jgi:hypothetical protein
LETTSAFEPEMKMENGWSKIQNEKKEVYINISGLGCVNGRYSSKCIMKQTSAHDEFVIISQCMGGGRESLSVFSAFII